MPGRGSADRHATRHVLGIFYAGEVVEQPEDLCRSLAASITFLVLDIIEQRAHASTPAAPTVPGLLT